MRRLAAPLAAFLFFTSIAVPAQAARKPLELKWSELGNMVVGHKVAITLTDDIVLGGEVASVRDDSIVLDVTLPAKGYPKGNGVVPRNAVKLIGLERTKGAFGRAIGTTFGVLGGMSLGAAAGLRTGGAGPALATFLVIAGAGTVSGYYIGRELDRRVTWIKILP